MQDTGAYEANDMTVTESQAITTSVKMKHS